jgi:hypothetical protein
MYIDQHTLEKLGTARLVARYAPDYEEYLSDVFGREWRLADPVEIKGTVRLLARFVPEKAASGEENGPVIQLFIEFNPAMGLYTVTGEFRRDGKLLYKSSPRMGFDDEMLGDPARIFDWLDQSVSMGESHDETPSLDGMVKALDGLKTPAGVVEATSQDEDGMFGREWRLADPVEIKGTVRLLARFVPEKAASGEENGPVIQLFIEFNPAMGLYTVTGEFRRDGKLLYKSSPRMGFDDEMLGDPARIFDWLDQSVSMGESHDETPSLDGMVKALDGLKTPAGVVEATSQDEDGIMVVVLDPEGRRSHDDFVVSGTRFPVAGAGSMAGVAPKSTDDWLRDYADPVLAAVQKTLDGLYGPEAFTAEMDAGGFVVVATQIPALKQETKEPGSWFAAEMRRMAGVDGSVRGNDKRISEVKAIKQSKMPPPKKVGPFSTARTPERDKLAKKLAKKPGVRDPQRLAFWIGLRAAGSKTEEMSSISNRMRDLLST